ncbi:hypothetical protein HYALB_00002030 [Hymenoscyphus albidus]|uniref:Uncharacterized protein n=1 Tax=Hymenoscyphus albidus TaxID=595503 RepID=A0A9N9Q1J2_9HELO|nr:hypothetical protein HYALB_00002030 [Hymenoscyphus albidus]
MPLHNLMHWSPLRLDALGLVTLIGAEEVNQAIGRLVDSKYTTFLPLLGQYLISGNQFTTAVPGFTLYNVTDAITTTSFAGWFSRWLSSQDLKTGTTVFEWNVLPNNRQREKGGISILIGGSILTAMLALTILMGDWWGVANSIALLVSVFVRWYLIRENNLGLNQTCQNACYTSQQMTQVKVLVTLDNGNLVTMYAPRGLVTNGFLKVPAPINPLFYTWTRRVGWLFFGVHVIQAQCNLVTQLLTVALLVGSTWLVVRGFGCDETEVGDSIRVRRVPNTFRGETDRRMWAYAKLRPTQEEEDSLSVWNLLPRKVNANWWKEYESTKQSMTLSEKSSTFSMVTSRSDSGLSTMSATSSEV